MLASKEKRVWSESRSCLAWSFDELCSWLITYGRLSWTLLTAYCYRPLPFTVTLSSKPLTTAPEYRCCAGDLFLSTSMFRAIIESTSKLHLPCFYQFPASALISPLQLASALLDVLPIMTVQLLPQLLLLVDLTTAAGIISVSGGCSVVTNAAFYAPTIACPPSTITPTCDVREKEPGNVSGSLSAQCPPGIQPCL